MNIADVNLSNVTITQNIADSDGDKVGQGGGIFETRNSYRLPSLTMQNTILAGNIDGSTQPTTDAPDCVGVLRSKGYNLIGELDPLCKITGTATGNQVGTTAAPLDPMVDVLQPLGNKLIHPLLPGSPAIDAGDTTGCVDNRGILLTWDQPGTLRPLDGDSDLIEICDIGAVEYTP